MEERDQGTVARRSFMRKAGMGGAVAGLMTAFPAFADAASADTTPNAKLVDAGAGMHAGLSTFQMMGIATVSRSMNTCAVGQMGMDTSSLKQLSKALKPVIGNGFSGPFAMLMYSQTVTSYKIDRGAGIIRARGVLRSITKVGGALIEDAESDYLVVAKDGRTSGPDSFSLNYVTPFWKRPNPMATPSKYVKGWSEFGGNFIVGEINVAR